MNGVRRQGGLIASNYGLQDVTSGTPVEDKDCLEDREVDGLRSATGDTDYRVYILLKVKFSASTQRSDGMPELKFHEAEEQTRNESIETLGVHLTLDFVANYVISQFSAAKESDIRVDPMWTSVFDRTVGRSYQSYVTTSWHMIELSICSEL